MIRNVLLFRYRILWHVLFWLCVYLFYSFTFGSNSSCYSAEFLVNLYMMPVRMIFTYAFIYFILPNFLLRRRYISFSFLWVIHAFLFGFCIWLIIQSFFSCLRCVFEQGIFAENIPVILRVILLNYPIPAIASAVVIFKRWYRTQQYSIGLEKEKLEAELNFLKSQIHPHFLFNTLNNLYALTLIKSDKAPDIVIKLSELLDYMLYDSNEKEVKLQKEINQLKGYIDLEKIRYGDRLNIKFEISGNYSGKYLAPFILLPFLENSFKHGASHDIDSPFIHISMDIQETSLIFKIKNSYKHEKQSNQNNTEGIGLKNVRRRLALLYPNCHHLIISKEQNVFEISLMINWKSKKQINTA